MAQGHIPADIQAVPQWVVWQYEERQGKRTKVPYCVATGERASTTDATTWTAFEAAEVCCRHTPVDGLGFVFTRFDNFVGVDLDACRDPATGVVAPWAMELVTLLNSYTEVTPSGTGLHILCRGKLPPGGRRKGKIELYEEGRYFTVTGQALENLPLRLEQRTEELAALHRRLFRPEAEAAPRTQPNGAHGPAPDQWTIIEKVLSHPKGGRLWRGDTSDYVRPDNDGRSEADAALCEVIAWFAGPDPALIAAVARQSSLYRPEKWDRRGDDYLARTIAFVLSKMGPGDFYHWRLDSLNSLNSLNSYNESPQTADEWPADLAPEAYHGMAGEIVQELAPETEADPAALLINILLTFGNAVGRNPHCRILATRHGANLFGSLVGLTGEGSKGTSWDPVQWLFERALPDYMETQVVGGIASGEGLIAFVRDRRERQAQVKDKKTGRMTLEFETIVEDEGVTDKRCLIVEAEMSGLLKIMGRPGNILSEQLRQAWDKGDLQNLSKNAPLKATGAHISLLGHITPDALKRHLTEAEAANGFANRFLWMLVRRSRFLPEGGTLPYLNTYITSIKELVELASEGPREIKREEGAKRIWAAVYPDLRRAEPGMVGELIARRAPIVARLSLVYALLDGMSMIWPQHLLAALAVWERSEASVRILFGQAMGDPIADTLMDAIQQRPEGAHRADLHAALGRNRRVDEIDRGLSLLLSAGRVRTARQKGDGGREVEVWLPATAPGVVALPCRYLEKAKAVYENNEFNENNDKEGGQQE